MPAPRRRRKNASLSWETKPEPIFWVALVFFMLVAVTGGSSRVDVLSLIILKPAAALVSALALITLRRSHVASCKWLFIGFGVVLALSLAHLVPMPPTLWQNLPGRVELAEADAVAGLGPVWRPLTVTPINGWHALTSLLVPLAVLLLGVQLNRHDLYRFLPVLLLLGMFSGLLGLLQVIGGSSTPLYFYRGNNNGIATGLFANRNHASILLAAMFPMLATWAMADENDPRKLAMRIWASIAVGIVLFPLILITGSRSGLLLSLMGLVAAIAMLAFAPGEREASRKRLRRIGIAAAGSVGVVLLGLLSLYLSKADAIMRLLNTSQKSEFRVDIWSVSLDLLWKYFPVGSGIGSFVEVYQIIEPAYQLNPQYRNHAHQEVLEIGIAFGLPGLILLAVAVLMYFRRSLDLWIRRSGETLRVRIARTAGIVIAMIGIASLADYPLRTPLMMGIFVLLSLWLVEPSRERNMFGAVQPAPGSGG